jgi:hypothetical protein
MSDHTRVITTGATSVCGKHDDPDRAMARPAQPLDRPPLAACFAADPDQVTGSHAAHEKRRVLQPGHVRGYRNRPQALTGRQGPSVIILRQVEHHFHEPVSCPAAWAGLIHGQKHAPIPCAASGKLPRDTPGGLT